VKTGDGTRQASILAARGCPKDQPQHLRHAAADAARTAALRATIYLSAAAPAGNIRP